MATYFVEINAHFMVKIEIDGSCAAAEHHFLDNHPWVWAANAYDEKGMKTECFLGALMTSTILSETELERKFAEMDRVKQEASDMEKRLDEAETKLAEAKKTYLEALAAAKEAYEMVECRYNQIEQRAQEAHADLFMLICENHAERPN